jgi:hypothetical protein
MRFSIDTRFGKISEIFIEKLCLLLLYKMDVSVIYLHTLYHSGHEFSENLVFDSKFGVDSRLPEN